MRLLRLKESERGLTFQLMQIREALQPTALVTVVLSILAMKKMDCVIIFLKNV